MNSGNALVERGEGNATNASPRARWQVVTLEATGIRWKTGMWQGNKTFNASVNNDVHVVTITDEHTRNNEINLVACLFY